MCSVDYMSYSEWTKTSNAYQVYATANTQCEIQMAPVRLTIALQTALATENSLEGRARKHARWTRENIETKLRKAKLAARPIEVIEAEAAAKRDAQEREIAQAHRDMVEAERGPLATEAQIRYIVRLEKYRACSGDDSGFISGPRFTSREQFARMTKREASQYITSLKGEY